MYSSFEKISEITLNWIKLLIKALTPIIEKKWSKTYELLIGSLLLLLFCNRKVVKINKY